jgi:hypothetical protein
MAWSVLTWKILRISQSQFLFGEVRAKSRHSSYTKRYGQAEKNDISCHRTIRNWTFGSKLSEIK